MSVQSERAAAHTPAHSSGRRRSASEPKADPGIAAFIIFFGAVLVIVFAVVVAGAIDRWWVLAPVMLVDFAVVFGVIATVNHLLADDGDSPA